MTVGLSFNDARTSLKVSSAPAHESTWQGSSSFARALEDERAVLDAF